MKKRKYLVPTAEVLELRSRLTMLVSFSSTSGEVDDIVDGGEATPS